MAIELQVNVPGNYLAIMKARLKIHGKFNRRKTLVLWCLFTSKKLSSADLFFYAGHGASYSSLRAELARLVRYRYIANSEGRYHLLSKGGRFLYAINQLYPDLWIQLSQGGTANFKV